MVEVDHGVAVMRWHIWRAVSHLPSDSALRAAQVLPRQILEPSEPSQPVEDLALGEAQVLPRWVLESSNNGDSTVCSVAGLASWWKIFMCPA